MGIWPRRQAERDLIELAALMRAYPEDFVGSAAETRAPILRTRAPNGEIVITHQVSVRNAREAIVKRSPCPPEIALTWRQRQSPDTTAPETLA